MLIVLGIISIILSVLTVSFSTTQKKARDARRKGDLKAIQNGLEQYYSSCSYLYPTAGFTAVQCGTTPAIISVIPVDPKGAAYIYVPTGAAPNINGFSLCANSMESESPTGYCVFNQQ